MKVFFVMLGGFLGSISRYSVGEWIHIDNGFPLGTLSINLIGCFILGWFFTIAGRSRKVRAEDSLLIGTGFIGSFTTFSTFSVETMQLFQHGLFGQAFLYILASTIVGILLAFLGYRIALSSKRGAEEK
ncbi:fluoride efflux transporter CrcB [Bacillus tuaregi]|uniref:fluoride efflux transporter CrcB n=1 Tax=Bacillus tuaregi TaxID=1816695 RepID=UPI0008F7FFA2|nr:fluoride efflux transporter CrcB [Bacillus tuaregi]